MKERMKGQRNEIIEGWFVNSDKRIEEVKLERIQHIKANLLLLN